MGTGPIHILLAGRGLRLELLSIRSITQSDVSKSFEGNFKRGMSTGNDGSERCQPDVSDSFGLRLETFTMGSA